MSTSAILTEPKQVLITGPSGGLVAGDAYFDGCRFGVCENDIAEGATGYMVVAADVRELAFAGGATPAKNAKAYWDPTGKKIYAAGASGRVLCGSFYAAAATDDATCQIMLDGGVVDEYEKGDITGVTAGTGLTGGGSTGAITVSADFGTASGKICQGNDARLSDARTPIAHVSTHEAGQADELNLDAMDYTNALLPGVSDPKAAIDEIVECVHKVWLNEKTLTIANLASSGSTDADADLIGGRVISVAPVSGLENCVAGTDIGVDGAITVTLAAAQAAGDAVL